jgi:hypothetical protein
MIALFFWVVTQYRFVCRYQRFGETFIFSPEDGDSVFLRNVSIYECTRLHYPEDQHLQEDTFM